MKSDDIAFTVGEFVALVNQTFEYAYPLVTITGELANFRVSKGKWVYFDLKDDEATVRFFGTVYNLPGPLEDGMLLAVQGSPRLHALYGFSVNVVSIRPKGEGSIKKAAALLEAKLTLEGLFDPSRKRMLPYPPTTVGLITSGESAAYRDFVKVLGARWGGLRVTLIDVQVQGEAAPGQLVAAIEQFNQSSTPPEVLVITRGGGSAEDLQAFSTEVVTRAVAASRIPTLVAIGHEVDLCLAELAADVRASTPSNAAELLTPDRRDVLRTLSASRQDMGRVASAALLAARNGLQQHAVGLVAAADHSVRGAQRQLQQTRQLVEAYNPKLPLKRGYVLLSKQGKIVRGSQLAAGDGVALYFDGGHAEAAVTDVTMDKEQ
ncbi:MAG TPA: exodeoxyribonuclease VII large subunit [Candidatus Saccharimonadales bacterium]|nr:exodeoxyribonuclease VII large subunit [Candidatus Saccharimonadales bacterium]